jgi:hypothetical protein
VNIWGSLSVVALKSGLFEKAGLPVEGIRSPVGRQTRDAMVEGRLDFGTFAVPTFLLGVDKGGPVALALAGNAGKTVHVLVRPDSPIGYQGSVLPLRDWLLHSGSGGEQPVRAEQRCVLRWQWPALCHRPVQWPGHLGAAPVASPPPLNVPFSPRGRRKG